MATHFDEEVRPADCPKQKAMVEAAGVLVRAAKEAVMSGEDAVTGDNLIELQMGIIGNSLLQVIASAQEETNAPIAVGPLMQCMMDIVAMGKPLGSEATLN